MDGAENSVTKLLHQLGSGDRSVESELVAIVLPHLRRIAEHYMRSERPDHTLQPTALVHEAYLRLVRIQDMNWENQSHFFGVAARLMRQILVDHARARNADKRPQGQSRILIDEVFVYSEAKSSLVLALDEALCRLAGNDTRMVRVVELRFFGGLTFQQVAQALNISEKTAKRDWQMARAWLQREMRNSDAEV
jgi:RNA polymerase sigma factor (TIGR02999 family)